MMNACNWCSVCQVNEIVYVDLVKIFYANLRIVEDHAESIVNNAQFAFDAREINELFGMPSEGNNFYKLKTQL